MFTFLTITYNHEKFILEHLESIKYQILKFGGNKEYQLIIADDSSRDGTIDLINKWLKENEYLFKDIEILESEINQGTCKNYVNGIRHIKGEYFKALAGDDIFGRDNIFKAVDLLKTYDVVISIIAPFNEKKLYKDRQIYSRIFSMYKFVGTDYSKISKNLDLFPMTPGVFTRKELYTEKVLSFVNEFFLVEDRSQAISIYEENINLKIGYHEKITVLYRHHENAITKTKDSGVTMGFKNDLYKLDKYVLKTSKSNFLKLRTRYNMLIRKIRNPKIALALNLDVLFYRISYLLNYLKYKDKMKEIIKESFLPNEKHIQHIVSEAKKYD